MMQDKIFQYVHTLFSESRDGILTVGAGDDRWDYEVDWDEHAAMALAQRCSKLVAQLTALAPLQQQLLTDRRLLTQEELQVWNTYLRPFPDHGMDMEQLRQIWEKEMSYTTLTPEEQALSREYDRWYEENAQERLPQLRCSPTALLCRARRYARLVQLSAPQAVLDAEARCLAEEFVLYHCLA